MDDAWAVGERRFVPPAAEAERGARRERLPVIRPPVLLGPEEVIVVLVLGAHERAEHEGPSVLRRDRRGPPRRALRVRRRWGMVCPRAGLECDGRSRAADA